MAATEHDELTIASDLVVTKYKMAAEMVNKIIELLMAECKPGVSVMQLCSHGDEYINNSTNQVFKRQKEMKKGVAFPTCVSVNNCICHCSPLVSDCPHLIKEGDMVKIDLGAHIDGYIAVAAHTFVVGASLENKVTGRKADVIHAAYCAAEAALRLVVPGQTNTEVTDAIQKAAAAYNCKPVEGMLSHQLKRFCIDAPKSIIQNPTEAQRKEHEKCEFERHEVYAIDVLVSTGEGKGRELDTRTTVYKKTDETYQLKMKASRSFYSDVDKKFGNLPFTLRSFEDEKKAKMGVVECVNHKLLEPFTVLYEKEGEYVAQFKYTVLLMPSGSHKITSGPLNLDMYETSFKIEDEFLKSVLGKSVGPKAHKKKKKRGTAAATAESATEENVDVASPTADGDEASH